MKKGFAIDIKLQKWTKIDEEDTVFTTHRSHYVGSLPEKSAETTFDKLSELLHDTVERLEKTRRKKT